MDALFYYIGVGAVAFLVSVVVSLLGKWIVKKIWERINNG